MRFINYSSPVSYPISMIDMEIAHDAVLHSGDECVMCLEYNCLYSAGKSYKEHDFVANTDYKTYYTTRGGRITVHNIGQCVVYPIIDIKKRGINVHQYVTMLEEWMIHTINSFGVICERSTLGVGVWADNGKLGFVGVRIVHGVTMHGFCINVRNDLEPFNAIIPCGIDEAQITSISSVLGMDVKVCDVIRIVKQYCPF